MKQSFMQQDGPVNVSQLICHLDDDVTLSGAGAVQFPVLLHHNDLSFFLNLLHVLLYLVEDAAVVLLGYAHKLRTQTEESDQ